MSRRWSAGNRVRLLENGDAFFPRVLEVIGQARREILLETFILFEDSVGIPLRAALIAAANRGVRVEATIDGYGSPDLSREFIDGLVAAGVRMHVFDPTPRILGVRIKLFRRMHRKIIVVDGMLAFVGGINFSADHLIAFGPKAKQDYAVEIEGPVVRQIHAFARTAIESRLRRWLPRMLARDHAHRRFSWRRVAASDTATAGNAKVLFLVRDNVAHRTDIERHYRAAIRAARHELVIANAYFVPGYRLLRDIRNAARRGVKVTLIVQAKPDQSIAILAARTLYGYLADGGVRIHEYDARAFHAKVALTDDDWATVGSSNLDPLSLALNLEANVFIRDRAFNLDLRHALDRCLADECQPVHAATAPRASPVLTLFRVALFFFLRRFHTWAALMPRHAPKVAVLQSSQRLPPWP